MDDDTLTTAARAVAEMAQAFTAEVDRLRAQLRNAEADSMGRLARARAAEEEIERLTARIRDLEARPVGGAAEMREAAARVAIARAKDERAGAAGGDFDERTWLALHELAREIRALSLPTPSPSTEPDAVPEGHQRLWIRVSVSEGVRVASVWDVEPARIASTVAIVVVDLPIAPTVRGAVVGGA